MGMIDMVVTGKKVYDIITENIPQKLEDGVLTVDEMATLIKDICETFDIKAEIRVPDDMKDKYLDIVD
jgi:hypothetical protein